MAATGRDGRDGANGPAGMNGRDSRPIPDPTVRTDELVEKAVKGLREILETRMNGVDAAISILQQDVRQRPHDIEVQIRHLQELQDEKFKSIENRNMDRDDKVKEAKADASVGISAALASAEKLVGASNTAFEKMFEKAERSTEKLLDKQDENQKVSTSALESKIFDLKGRLDRIEGAAVGMVTAKTDAGAVHTAGTQNIGMIVGLVGVGIAVVALIERFVR